MIYVDELKNHGWRLRGRVTLNCHMFTDGYLEELHRFANRIEMKREWFQDEKYPHYDLTPKRRKIAVEHGAIEITTKEWMKKERTKILLDKIENELFGELTANTYSTPPPIGNLSMKDITDLWEKINKNIPPEPYPNMKDGVINPTDAEILLPLAINIKRDPNGKLISFKCFGKNFKIIKYLPERTIYLFDLESVGIMKRKEE